ncbi:hypothetical protein MJO29_009983 [Puccinia striiformis f. sp. tritici]|nr:hypothetical protein MJO29_009983 [Puccinia striiformis f. sp. tritici]
MRRSAYVSLQTSRWSSTDVNRDCNHLPTLLILPELTPWVCFRSPWSKHLDMSSRQAVLAITRVTDSYRHHPDKLQQLLTPDVLSSLTALLSPVGGTKISDNIFSAILKSFTNIGRSSPEVATNLLDAGLADTVYGILIGQTPPEIPDEHDLALELTSNSSVITQALMRKDRNQIQQAIDLVVEVLPPLPKTGTFDPKLAKRPTTPHENVAMKDEEATYTSVTEAPAPSNEASNSFSAARSLMDEDVVQRFNALLLPTLLEVYGASVSSAIRLKALVAVLKIAYFSKTKYLTRTLKPIPLASFLASILANRDQNSLVMYALQMVDLLLAKLPDDYDFIFRREGVMHEVNRLAESTPTGSSIKTRISNVPVGGSRSESHMSAATNALDEELLQVPSSLGRHSSSINAFSSASTSSSSTSTKDQLIYRACHLKAKCVMAETTASIRAQEILDNIRDVVNALGTVQTTEEAKLALTKLAALFSRENDPATSFELLESGLVEGLLRFATESRSFGPPLNVRSKLLSETFFSSSEDSPAFLPLVKRLQESLGRLRPSIVVVRSECTSLPVTNPRSFFYNLLSSSPLPTTLPGEGEKISLVATLPSTNGHGYFDTIGGVHPVHHHQPGCSTHQQYSHLGHHHVTSPLSGRKPISLDVIGSITARISPGSAASVRILTLCVSPDYRRFGVGKLLLDHLLKQIKLPFSRLSTLSSSSSSSLTTTTHSMAKKISVNLHVQATNLVAHSFYKRAGFKTLGFKPSYYSDNELRPLDPTKTIIQSSSPTNSLSSTDDDHHHLSSDPFNQQISLITVGDLPSDIDAWFLELTFDSI